MNDPDKNLKERQERAREIMRKHLANLGKIMYEPRTDKDGYITIYVENKGPIIEMGWVHGEKYDWEARIHLNLVPYAQLGQLKQDKDSVFVALCKIARQWIYK